jgi:polyphosphate kinase 2
MPLIAQQEEWIMDKKKINLDELHAKKLEELSPKIYKKELKRLQIELVKMQDWVATTKAKVIIIFEGRDAAGKGGAIKRIVQALNPRICKIAALGTPSDKEKTQWYFQRYIPHLPSGGEIVLFDRSWYNRAGVEKVMGFCTDEEYEEFFYQCPEFEKLLVRSGITVIKYWFSVSDTVQEERFRERAKDPVKRWKLSPMDIKSRDLWVEYSKAKDRMFSLTDTKFSPWYVVNADIKQRARLNCINHLLSKVPYKTIKNHPIKLTPRKKQPSNYVRPPISIQNFVPDNYS